MNTLLYHFSPSGSKRWREVVDVKNLLAWGTITINSGRVIASFNGILYCFEPTGKLLWFVIPSDVNLRYAGAAIITSPITQNIFVITNDGISTATIKRYSILGQIQTTFKIPSELYHQYGSMTPAMLSNGDLVFLDGYTAFRFSPTLNVLVWSVKYSEKNITTQGRNSLAVARDDTIFINTAYNLFAISKDGDLLWSKYLSQTLHGEDYPSTPLALGNSVVYYTSKFGYPSKTHLNQKTIIGFDYKGNEVFRKYVGVVLPGNSLLVNDNRLFFLTADFGGGGSWCSFWNFNSMKVN